MAGFCALPAQLYQEGAASIVSLSCHARCARGLRGTPLSQDLKERRHLLRLWLSPAEERELPPAYEELYGRTEVLTGD
jgi:hypothetical protein